MYFEFDNDEMESLKNIVLFLYRLHLLQVVYMDASLLPKTSKLIIFIFSLVKYENIRHPKSQM